MALGYNDNNGLSDYDPAAHHNAQEARREQERQARQEAQDRRRR